MGSEYGDILQIGFGFLPIVVVVNRIDSSTIMIIMLVLVSLQNQYVKSPLKTPLLLA